MLTLYNNGSPVTLPNDDYYIKEKYDGADEVIFEISIWDKNYQYITEEAQIITSEDGQRYVIKAIDGGSDSAKVKGLLDTQVFMQEMHIPYTNGSNSLSGTITGILPSGWTFQDHSGATISRTIELEAATPADIVTACADTYSVVFRYDTANNILHAYNPESFQPLGAFATRELNLKEINYKGKSDGIVTRLYAVGKDGLTFESINDGKPYVDNNTYTDAVICGYWKDDRYTVAENLLADAKKQLETLAMPERSYTCSVVDLANTNPELYGFLDFSLFNVVTLIDETRNSRVDHQVTEFWRYPYYPEKNEVTLSTVPPRIQNTVKNIQNQIENPISTFNQVLQAAIDTQTQLITGGLGGYVVFVPNADGKPSELLIMDTPDIATATKVWRWNSGGLGYSSNGYNGPYTLAITQDGAIVADFITTGTLNAGIIKAGTLESTNEVASLNLSTGQLSFNMGNDYRMTLDIYGITIEKLDDPDLVTSIGMGTDGKGYIQTSSIDIMNELRYPNGYVVRAKNVTINGETLNILYAEPLL